MSETLKNNDPAVPSSAPVSPAGEAPEAEGSPSLESESPAAGLNDRWLVPGVCLFLAAMVWVVFGQTLGHEFVNYDDELYVAGNQAVLGGLSLKGIVWAFTHNVNVNWTPLTVISHMLDCELYGTDAGWHHLTSVLLHTASVILLFLVLRQMTGALWRSAFVAAVFAIHPLHVESVAWIAERRDVLSGLFFMLTLWAYARYVQKQSRVEGRASSAGGGSLALDPRRWTLDYYLVLLFFALGLMSKPMLVTLPFVLLLLDYWPLKRFAQPGGPMISWRLIAEKVPLLALSGAACAATLFAQQGVIESLPLSLRIGNALVSYAVYLKQMFYPAGLAVLYPYPVHGLPVGEMITAFLVLAFISAGVFLWRRTRPYLLVGWLWYLGMLVPAIGLIQSGLRAHADRYTYLPQIGLSLLLAWAAADLCAGWRYRRVMMGGLATVILVALMFCARPQTSYWRNDESLWIHTLACMPDNTAAHNNLANALLLKGRVDEAIAHFQTALQITPDDAGARLDLGNAFLQKGKVDEAITQYQKALQLNPDHAEAHYNFGNALFKKGGVDEAITQYQKALQIKPAFAEARHGLGNALFQNGRVDEAIAQYRKAFQINPDDSEVCFDLGNALLQKGGVDEAIAQYQQALQIKPGFAEARNNLDHALLIKSRVDEVIAQYQKALRLNPDNADVLNNLAWLLATCPDARIRDGAQAVQYAGRACELTHNGVTILVGTLAAAYAEAGRYDDAIAAAQKACALATAAGEWDLLGKNQQLLALYLKHQPYHEAAGKFVSAAP